MIGFEIWIYKDVISWKCNEATTIKDLNNEGVIMRNSLSDIDLRKPTIEGGNVIFTFSSDRPVKMLNYLYICKIYDMVDPLNTITYENISSNQGLFDILKGIVIK